MDFHIIPKTSEKNVQNRFQNPHDAHKMLQSSPKTPQDAPRRPQDATETPQDAHKMLQGSPKTPQDAPKTPLRHPKTLPRRPQNAHKTPQKPPKEHPQNMLWRDTLPGTLPGGARKPKSL